MKVGPDPVSKGERGSSKSSVSRSSFAQILKQLSRQDMGSAALESQVPAFPVPLSPGSVAYVDSGENLAALPPVLTSLVQEIASHAPPEANASVEIQFHSNTLDGLLVKIHGKSDQVDIRLFTDSEAVRQLLSTNLTALSQALEQRGYVAPTVTIAQPNQPVSFADARRRPRREKPG